MFLLLGVGFLGGVITGISPCVIPVLPVIVAGGSTGTSSRRPISIIAGLVVSFSVVVLVGGEVLSLLHLPQDLIRDVGIAALFLVAAGLLLPRLGDLLERPFARLGAKRQSETRNGFLLGASLGFVFVPCAGPVLATITDVAASHRVGVTAVLVTLAYALGAAIPLLGLALLAQRTTSGFKSWRAHMPLIRKIAGGVLAVTALAILLNWTNVFSHVPGYTTALQNHIEGNTGVTKALHIAQGRYGQGVHQRAGRRVAPEPRGGAQLHGHRRSGSTPRGTSRSRSRSCAARWCSSTSGPTRASTASAPSRTSRPGPRLREGRARRRRRAHAGVPLRARRVEREGSRRAARRHLPDRHRQQLRAPGTRTTTTAGRPST